MHSPNRHGIFETVSPAAADYVDRDALPDKMEVDDPALDTLWQTWASLTFELMRYGFSHRTICDTVEELIPVVEQSRATETAAH